MRVNNLYNIIYSFFSVQPLPSKFGLHTLSATVQRWKHKFPFEHLKLSTEVKQQCVSAMLKGEAAGEPQVLLAWGQILVLLWGEWKVSIQSPYRWL